MSENLKATLAWSRRIQRGEGLRLRDLCLSTVQRHVRELAEAAGSGEVIRPPESQVVYRSRCPICGSSLVLHRLEGE